MPKVVSFLDRELIENIQNLYLESNKPLSKIVAELIEIGYQAKRHFESKKIQGSESVIAEEIFSIKKHTEYLLRTMAMVADSYRCVRNAKSRYSEENFEEVLTKITNYVQNYIDEKLSKD